ncbi:hypothetical protein FRC20_007310, partial [Serendipita sp. 405]
TPSTPLTAKHGSFLKEDLEGQNRVESLPRDEVTEEPHGTKRGKNILYSGGRKHGATRFMSEDGHECSTVP